MKRLIKDILFFEELEIQNVYLLETLVVVVVDAVEVVADVEVVLDVVAYYK